MEMRVLALASEVFGDRYSDETGLGETLLGAEQHAREGNYAEAAEALLEIAASFHFTGYPHLVQAAVGDLRALLGRHLTQRARAWAFNYEALAHAALGDLRAEGRALEKMAAIGERLNDRDLVSTAQQNQALLALNAGEMTRSIEISQLALDTKIELGDQRAAAEILLNLASALTQSEDADHVLEAIERLRPVVRGLDDPGLVSSIHGIRGIALAEAGRFDEAKGEFRSALRLARKAGQRQKEVWSLQNLGALEANRGRPARAVRFLRQAIELAEAGDAPPQLEVLYRSLAFSLHAVGRTEEAAAALGAARDAAARLRDDSLYAGATSDIGALWLSLGDYTQARSLLEEALNRFRNLEDHAGVVEVLTNLSAAQESLGDGDAAEASLREAVGLSPTNERKPELLRRLAGLQLTHHKPLHAAEVFTEELRLADELGFSGTAERAAEAAAALAERGAHLASLTFYDQAFALYRRSREAERAFQVRNDRAIALDVLGRHREAEKEFRAARGSARRMQNRALELQASMNLGELLRRRGELRASAAQLARAEQLATALSDMHARAEVMLLRGLLERSRGDVDEARLRYIEAGELARALRAPAIAASSIGGLAALDYDAGRFRRAASKYRRALALAPEPTKQVVEDAAGYLLSLSAARVEEGLQEATQQLIDRAQEIGAEGDAAIELCSAAHQWLLHDEVETASSLYTAAIIVGLVGATLRDARDNSLLYGVMMPVTLMVLAAEPALANPERLYTAVQTMLRERYDGWPEFGHELVREAIETAREQASDDHDALKPARAPRSR